MRSNSLFEPDVLIGELAGSARRHAAVLSSEKRLMLAVLRNALECYQQNFLAEDPTGREMFREAAAWIENTSYAGLFSFEGITEALDIEPNYLRRQLAEWQRRRLLSLPPESISDKPAEDSL
jgi:hypothetical protein